MSISNQVAAETAKAVPPVVITLSALVGDLTINHVVGTVTVLYILLQAAYLIWKWRRDRREDRRRNGGGCAQ